MSNKDTTIKINRKHRKQTSVSSQNLHLKHFCAFVSTWTIFRLTMNGERWTVNGDSRSHNKDKWTAKVQKRNIRYTSAPNPRSITSKLSKTKKSVKPPDEQWTANSFRFWNRNNKLLFAKICILQGRLVWFVTNKHIWRIIMASEQFLFKLENKLVFSNNNNTFNYYIYWYGICFHRQFLRDDWKNMQALKQYHRIYWSNTNVQTYAHRTYYTSLEYHLTGKHDGENWINSSNWVETRFGETMERIPNVHITRRKYFPIHDF